MKLDREEDIRSHIEAWLKQQGVSVEREVVCGNGVRADLVTSDTVIEVKKYLNRGALYQAYGQGAAYQKLLKKPKLLIIGLAPTTDTRYQEAQRIAENIRTDSVQVVFLEKDLKTAQLVLAASLGNFQATAEVRTQPAAAPVVKLPFEPVAASPQAPASNAPSDTKPAASTDSANGAANHSPKQTAQPSVTSPTATSPIKLTHKDVLPLILLILLFLWLKAAYWKQSQIESDLNQPTPELTSPP